MLENLNLSGVINANSLCKLHNLRVLSLPRSLIHGTIPNSIWHCSKLRYLNFSSNNLSGRIPLALIKLENLQSLDISNNHFKHLYRHSLELIALQRRNTLHSKEHAVKLSRQKEILKISQDSPQKMPPTKDVEEVKAEESQSDLVFFVENDQRFRPEDLLEAAADLLGQSICSSLYKVILRDNAAFAVKRVKKLHVSIEEFSRTMRKIGNIKHPDILPLVAYKSTDGEKLLIYQYQSNGSLLNLLESYSEGKRGFPWKLRLSIASGLTFMHQRLDGEEGIPHGNIKLSNILLDDNMEPLISEYGISRFLDPKKKTPFASHSYTAPEKSLKKKETFTALVLSFWCY
ncbi:hypothetical protein SLEP1_g46577 [Rubroshorea leprosula]|uniref:Protein kinase domain-containing protein n=1 Tax=Rubroshorea leprosula TaxID=152421 RepID=A0AAV5LQ59_9ROSI|nr:hypothetical protein SLEP1_g46577 [Rubroshorea leprosula]